MAETTTTRTQMHRWSADTDTPSRDEFDGSFGNIELFMVGYQHGTLALRPAPGKFGWFYQADDNGHIYWDTGTAWMDLTMVYGAAGDISPSAPGDTALAGAVGMPSDAGHRHARESFAAAMASIRFGIAKSDGAAGTLARSDHIHGTPAIHSAGAGVASRAALNFVGLVVTDDASGDQTVITMPLAAVPAGALTVGGAGVAGVSGNVARQDHTHDVSKQLPGYTEMFHDVTATTATTTLDCSTSCNKRVTLQTNTALAFANVPTGCVFSITVWEIQDGTGGRTVTYPAGTRWQEGVAPSPSTAPNARNVVTLTTFDGGASWDAFFSGRDMK